VISCSQKPTTTQHNTKTKEINNMTNWARVDAFLAEQKEKDRQNAIDRIKRSKINIDNSGYYITRDLKRGYGRACDPYYDERMARTYG
jgi:hypothetical protein